MGGKAELRLGGRYQLIEPLGTGGMAVVWRARDEILGREVAVKVLDAKRTDADSRERIRIEAKAAAHLSHPNITSVFDYGESRDARGARVPYVVMELLHGQPLSARLKEDDGPEWREIVTIAAQVAAALAAAHAQGVVHRDIKPANIVLSPSGAKVVDFGIAGLAGAPSGDANGLVFGTPAYLAPERLAGEPIVAATDVYALGMLLYRCLAGHLPWQTDTITQMIRAHQSVPPEPLPPIEGLPPEVAELCDWCLEKDPEQRPTSVEAARILAAAVGVQVVLPKPGDPALPDLRPALVDQPAGPSGGRGPTRRRRRLILTGAVVTTAAVSAVAWAAVVHRGSAPTVGAAPKGPVTATVGRDRACEVLYRVRPSAGGSFTAELAVTNAGPPVAGWTLGFAFPGPEQIVSGTGGTWWQTETAVRVSAPTAIATGGSVAVTGTGNALTTNATPTGFTLNDVPCTYRIAVGDGEPAPPVPPGRGSQTPVQGNAAPGAGSGDTARPDVEGAEPGVQGEQSAATTPAPTIGPADTNPGNGNGRPPKTKKPDPSCTTPRGNGNGNNGNGNGNSVPTCPAG